MRYAAGHKLETKEKLLKSSSLSAKKPVFNNGCRRLDEGDRPEWCGVL